jgi:hypothetical protein
MPFGGETYDKDKDGERLKAQLERIKNHLLTAKGEWVNLQKCEVALPGEGTAAITARARDLRKKKFGNFVVDCRRRPGVKNQSLYEYRIPWENGKPATGPRRVNKENKVSKLFKLARGKKEGCEANRCKETEVQDIPGELWGRESVRLCPRHTAEALAFAEANPDYEPPKPPAGLAAVDQALNQELSAKAQEAQETLEALKAYTPQTQEDLDDVTGWLKDAKVRRNWLEAREKEITTPMRASIEKVRELFRPAKQYWADVEMLLKSKIAAMRMKEEQRNREALIAAAQAQQAGDQAGTQAALSQVTSVGDLKGISTRIKWKFEVVNAAEVPREYLKIDEQKLREYCSRFKGDQKPHPVPGVRFIEDVPVSVRT